MSDIDCSVANPSGGDQIRQALLRAELRRADLRRADLWFSSDTAGDYTLSLTARQGAYNGSVIGTAQATVSLAAGRFVNTEANFDFDGAPAVAAGTLVTFSIAKVGGPGNVVFYWSPARRAARSSKRTTLRRRSVTSP